jgi:hypothetical protein
MTPAWPRPSRVSVPACIGILARSNPTRIIFDSRKAISSAGSFADKYAPSFQSERWTMGKPTSKRRQAATRRCDVFSSARRLAFTPRFRLVVAVRPQAPRHWQRLAHIVPMLAANESAGPSPRCFWFRGRPPALPKPLRDAQAHRPPGRRVSHEIRCQDIPLPMPFPSNRGCSGWIPPNGDAWPGGKATPRHPLRFGRIGQQ